MRVDTYRIVGRTRPYAASISSVSDFVLEPDGDIALTSLGGRADWSLYCLDVERRTALMVQMPRGAALDSVPFLYQLQYEHAQRAALLSFDQLRGLAAQLDPGPPVAFLLSTGRCGSTLASRMLSEVPGVISLSEPDSLSNLAMDRAQLRPGEAETLLAASTRVLATPFPDASAVVIKPRAEAIVLAPALTRALPDARIAFLYRDMPGFTASLHRFVQRILGDGWENDEGKRINWFFSSVNQPLDAMAQHFADPSDVQGIDILAFGWRVKMEGYLAALGSGVPMTPIHYADLKADRARQTGVLLTACGIDPSHAPAAMQAFATDAHEGGHGANTIPTAELDPQQRARLSDLLRRWNMPAYTDERLPGSVD